MYSPMPSIYLTHFQFPGEAESGRRGEELEQGEGLAEHALWGVNVGRNQGCLGAGVEENEVPYVF